MNQIELNSISTRAPKDLQKEKTKEKTDNLLKELNELQNLLYAENKHAVLVIIQGMDASGKDGVVRHVFGHLNPQGVCVQSFKTPSALELSYDFLWRIHQHVPAKGMIQVFNRSHYEDVLVTRVHKLIDDDTAKKRFKAINNFEEMLINHNNTHILKFYLHVSKEEQHERIDERLKDKTKHWKYDEKDLSEIDLRDEYVAYYEECFRECNAVSWTIVPADQNWYKEYIIAAALHQLLESLKMEYPALKK